MGRHSPWHKAGPGEEVHGPWRCGAGLGHRASAWPGCTRQIWIRQGRLCSQETGGDCVSKRRQEAEGSGTDNFSVQLLSFVQEGKAFPE